LVADAIPYLMSEKAENTHPSEESPNKHVQDEVFKDGTSTPIEEDLISLRRVSSKIPLVAYSLCIVEFAERASYYGCTFVFSNFVQFPLP
jgi:hypothetical protein